MGFSMEYSGLLITHFLYKSALLVALVRWVFRWAFTSLGLRVADAIDGGENQSQVFPSSSSLAASVSAETVRGSLRYSTYGEVARRRPGGCRTCAVCLGDLRRQDRVWELRSCCHVFHRSCLDRWLDHDEQKTCPLCRAPLMRPGPGSCLDRPEPSWAVERFLYLFGDDLFT